MRSRQASLDSRVTAAGIGLHGGERVSMTLHPAEVGAGVVFIRAGMGEGGAVAARYDCVSDTRLCTRLANAAGGSVSTVEHFLAACAVCGVDNLRVEMDAGELPVMDGSAAPFAALLDEGGVKEQQAPRRFLRIVRPVSVVEGEKRVELSPHEGRVLDVTIDFGERVIGRQSLQVDMEKQDFRAEILPARTFAFAREVEAMREQGLALGGSLENAVVVGEDGILNEEGLRFADEFVRHKILDALGDLFLAGAPILGRYTAHAPGHALNNALLRRLFATPDAWEYVENA